MPVRVFSAAVVCQPLVVASNATGILSSPTG